MMTFGYLQTMIERNLTHSVIINEMEDICKLFSQENEPICKDIVTKELERIFEYNEKKYTNQEYCYHLGECKKPGPKAKENTQNTETIKNVFKPLRRIYKAFTRAFEDL